MTLEEIVGRMHEKKYLLEMGCGKLSKWFTCSKDDIREAKRIVRNNINKIENNKKPKILIFDLETSPLLAYVWRMWDQNISLDALVSEWFLLSYSCKWFGEDRIYSNVLTPTEVKNENDFRLVIEMWEFLDQADIVIAHNGKRFDIPRIKARFLVHKLTPTSYYKQIDTLAVAKSEFGFPSNKLDALARFLDIDGKIPTGLNLWINCMKGDQVSLKLMENYNKNDVVVLEKVYIRMRPYIKSHPNFNLYNDTNAAVCPSCGGDDLIPDNHYYTQTGKYDTFKCQDCGGISRKRKNSLKKEKELLLSIPGR